MRLSYNGQYTSLPSWGRGFDAPQPLQRNEFYQQRTAAPQDSRESNTWFLPRVNDNHGPGCPVDYATTLSV